MDGFPIYKPKNLGKVNALRKTISQPTVKSVPTLSKGQLLFSTSESRNGEPASCYTCDMFNRSEETCAIHGPGVITKKFISGEPFKRIEFWPCCSYHLPGEAEEHEETHYEEKLLDPDYSGLIWINAPKVGEEYGGANCGGINGGDDCDHYMTEGDDKRACPTGFCRVLQVPVANGDVCSAWEDDDQVPWRMAQKILKGGRNG